MDYRIEYTGKPDITDTLVAEGFAESLAEMADELRCGEHGKVAQSMTVHFTVPLRDGDVYANLQFSGTCCDEGARLLETLQSS